ncbi:MAG: putative histidine kinase, hybrid [Ramlibacter sp.]|jgi:CheY-like chemotaxis protein|nr:putative histidine kinase, hybrid [Ramlibacter sp.]
MIQKRVLVIDDHRDAADTLAALLRARDPGLDVSVGYDGEAAVALARDQRPDAVVIDLELPRLGGAEAASKIRSALPDAPPLLIALSGNLFKVAKARQGTLFDHAVVKPVDVEDLLSILDDAG